MVTRSDRTLAYGLLVLPLLMVVLSASAQSVCQTTVGGNRYDITFLSSYQTSVAITSVWELKYQPCTGVTCGGETGVAICEVYKSEESYSTAVTCRAEECNFH